MESCVAVLTGQKTKRHIINSQTDAPDFLTHEEVHWYIYEIQSVTLQYTTWSHLELIKPLSVIPPFIVHVLQTYSMYYLALCLSMTGC